MLPITLYERPNEEAPHGGGAGPLRFLWGEQVVGGNPPPPLRNSSGAEYKPHDQEKLTSTPGQANRVSLLGGVKGQ